jgi:site-specific DNA-methyltransferase (cytosine-N4-specific)
MEAGRSMSLYYQDDHVTLIHGDAIEESKGLDDGSVDCIVTSPPYFGLRDYGVDGQYGLETSPAEYVETMRALFSELRRVLADDGTLWLNIGDSYYSGNGSPTKPDDKREGRRGFQRVLDKSGQPWARKKNLLGIPWRVAFALQDDGWNLRNDIIWHKPNVMHEPVNDRYYSSHEHIFMFSKSKIYSFNGERGADVWDLNTKPFREAHFAVFPPELPRRCILAGSKPGGAILDPFSGSGTTGMVAQELGRKYVGIDISAEYLKLSLETRLSNGVLDLGGAA